MSFDRDFFLLGMAWESRKCLLKMDKPPIYYIHIYIIYIYILRDKTCSGKGVQKSILELNPWTKDYPLGNHDLPSGNLT